MPLAFHTLTPFQFREKVSEIIFQIFNWTAGIAGVFLLYSIQDYGAIILPIFTPMLGTAMTGVNSVFVQIQKVPFLMMIGSQGKRSMLYDKGQ